MSVSTPRGVMRRELAAWCFEQGLPSHVLGKAVTAEKLLASPDSLTPDQRTWLRNFARDYSDAK